MAKMVKSVTFNNALIDNEAGTIYEMDKDGDIVARHDLNSVLQMWDNVPGVSISIKKTNDVAQVGE